MNNKLQPMKCMEVRGGCGGGVQFWRRPGLDVRSASRIGGGATQCGGDLFLISSCASGRITRILMADVCAPRPVFSELAAQLRDIMKRNVNVIRQTRAVRQMSDQLACAWDNGGMASTLLATWFSPTRSFSLCNAGHPMPLVWRCTTGEWSVPPRPPGGNPWIEGAPSMIVPGEYQQLRIPLDDGDMLLAYSNSLTEALDENGRTIGVEGLLERVRRLNARHPAESLPARALESICGEHPGNLDSVDATIILCQSTTTPVGWRDQLLAPFRLFRPTADRTSLEQPVSFDKE